MSGRIFLSPPWTAGEERSLVEEAFDSGYVAPCGPFVDRFERELEALSARRYAVAVSSGTAALDLLADCLSIGPRTTVIAPSLTFIATVGPSFHRGAQLAFVDSCATGNVDMQLLEEALASTPGEKVFIGVDLYGRPLDYAAAATLCDRYGAKFVSDSAEAVGAAFCGAPAGSGGIAGVYSFNGNKIVTTSGGGAVVTDSAEIAARVRKLSTQSRENVLWYEHREAGYNYRMSNILAAIGLAQLSKLTRILAVRRENRERYESVFAGLPGAFLPGVAGENNWLTVRLLDSSEERDGLIAALEAADVETRPVWKPLHLQPVFAGVRMFGGGVCEDLFRRGVCLPSGTGMSDSDFSRIEKAVRRFYDNRRT